MCRFCLFFFFSSRRRHTRYIGDWSSDVCSSDLSPNGSAAGSQRYSPEVNERAAAKTTLRLRERKTPSRNSSSVSSSRRSRSEERRVGKECRNRGTREHRKTEKQQYE